VALEASSHGLDQYRLDGVELTAAIFTRLGEDHLDYHQTSEAYLEAKLRLVKDILPQGKVFVCDDDAPGAKKAIRAAEEHGHKIIRVGTRAGTQIQIKSCQASAQGQLLHIVDEGGAQYEITFPLHGRFQAINALLAAGAIIGTEENINVGSVFAALESVPAIPGRLEKITRHKDADIFIDYAHTPDALESALSALRESLSPGGKLHLVFGAGGDRDKHKRPLMARIAKRLADKVIITDDNPRYEKAEDIRAALQKAAPDASNIGDRKEAIATGIKNIKPRDILLVAGKGHENYQERDGTQIKFSDAETIRALSDA
jgi:UDP-N-acetylmuramoyl-L-alanyl-D-glutamate--2,6-diaminopimelate ligase